MKRTKFGYEGQGHGMDAKLLLVDGNERVPEGEEGSLECAPKWYLTGTYLFDTVYVANDDRGSGLSVSRNDFGGFIGVECKEVLWRSGG
jgi:hypothetical protein